MIVIPSKILIEK